jgi:hypothetical protein
MDRTKERQRVKGGSAFALWWIDGLSVCDCEQAFTMHNYRPGCISRRTGRVDGWGG